MAATTKAKIRMYRLKELGDCFLVTLSAGTSRSHLLIDCGSFRNSGVSIQRLGEITAQIRKDLAGDKLDVVVGTHQHNDHLSGFLHHEEDFKGMSIGQVWLSWLDDPKDSRARKIGRDQDKLRLSLAAAMHGMRRRGAARGSAARSLEVVQDMLGFFGASTDGSAPPEVPAKAVAVLKTLGAEKPRYLRPGQVFDVPGLPAGAVRVHVLGPPRDEASLYRIDPRTGESYDHALANATRMAATFVRALARGGGTGEDHAEEREYPFNARYKLGVTGIGSDRLEEIKRRYRAAKEKWRRIDDDWMNQAESLALYLNDFTNNSSLVLALELMDSGKVLLFAADAQTGNWASWTKVKWEGAHPGTRSLLQRTVFYKVGHHASRNATYLASFEAMGGDDLCALIPVHKKDPNIAKKGGWKMPARKLYKRLVERTEGRVLQMDNVNPPEASLTSQKVKDAWKKVGISPKVTPLAIELEIQ